MTSLLQHWGLGLYALGGIAASLLVLLGFVQNWFWAVPIASTFAVCSTFGKTAVIPGVILGFLLDIVIALAIGYIVANRLKAQRAIS